MIYRVEVAPIEGPFTPEYLRESDQWAADLMAWTRGERSKPPKGVHPTADGGIASLGATSSG